MSPSLIGAGGVVVLFALLLLRVPVWIALVLVGFFGNVLVNGWPAAFALAGTAPFDVASSYTLSVVPLFILMGEVASDSRLSGELFNAARVILSGFRGGLAVATLAASALFGAVSGSSLGELRHHDPDGAAGAAQGRLRRRPLDRLHRRRRLDRHPDPAVDHPRHLCRYRRAFGAEAAGRGPDSRAWC